MSYPSQSPRTFQDPAAQPPGPYLPPSVAPAWGQPAAWAQQAPYIVNPGRRLAARIIDIIAWYLLAMAVNVPTLVLTGSDTDATTTAQWIIALWIPVSAVLYYALPLALTGMTLGKRILRLRVVRVDGAPVGFGGALGREAFFLVGSIIPGLSLLNPLWCLWDKPYQQCLHDKVVRTRVVPRG